MKSLIAAPVASVSISANAVTARFGAKTVLNRVSLAIGRGERAGVVGANGSGKTLLVSVLAGLRKPAAGTVRILGEPAGEMRKLGPRRGILCGEVSLPAAVRAGPLLAHLARLSGARRKAAEHSARSVLDELGVPDLWDQRCSSLTPGRTKLFGLAQALLGKPEVLLLDEPLESLDSDAVFRFRQALMARPECTVLVCATNQRELSLICDRLFTLTNGIITEVLTAADGSLWKDHDQLPGVFRSPPLTVAPTTSKSTREASVAESGNDRPAALEAG